MRQNAVFLVPCLGVVQPDGCAAFLRFLDVGLSIGHIRAPRSELGQRLGYEAMFYTVRKGDTLSGIAARLHVKTSVLGYINRVSNLNRLSVGQHLLLPMGANRHEAHSITHPHKVVAPTHYAGVDLKPLAALVPPNLKPTGNRPTKLGDLSMAYETGRHPGQELLASATVSSGKGDPDGGVSYGAYQFSSKQGIVGEFLASEGAPWASEFGNSDATIADGDFAKVWKKVAAKEGMRFFNAQHDYIKRTHYDKAIRKIFEVTGVNLDTSGIAIRNAIWSMAVQHGRAAQVIEEAMLKVHGVLVVADDTLTPYQAAKASFGNDISYQRALLTSMYDVRIEYVVKHKHGDLKKRYYSEEADALAEFTKYGTESEPR